MAFTDLGTIGVGGATTNNQASIAITTTAACAVGELVVIVVAVDNRVTGGGDDLAVSGVQNSGTANTWNKAIQVANNVAAQGGASVSIWWTEVTTQINSGATITATFTLNTTSDATAIIGRHFSMGAGMDVALEGTPTTVLRNTAAAPGSLDLTTANIECLRIRAIGIEMGATTALTPTASWTAWAAGQSATSGTTGEMAARAEHRIFTGTTAASNPTLIATAINANAYVAFKEVQPTVNVTVPVTAPTMTASVGGATVTAVVNVTVPVTAPGMTASVGAVTAQMYFTQKPGTAFTANANSKTGTTLAVQVLGTDFPEAGDVIVVALGSDNAGITDDIGPDDIVGITDDGGNTYLLMHGYRQGAGTAKAGVHVSLWYSRLTTGLSSGQSVTITNATANFARAACVACYTVRGPAVLVAVSQGSGDTGTPSSASLAGLPSDVDYLFAGVAAHENDTPAGAPASTWSEGNLSACTTGGSAAANIGMAFALHKEGVATGKTYDPQGLTNGNVSIICALKAADPDVTVNVTAPAMTASVGDVTVSLITRVDVTVPIGVGGTEPSSSLIASFTPGPDRNNFTGEVGVRWGIGGADILVSWLGMYVTTTGGTRTVRLYEWFGDTVLRTVTFDFTGKTPGTWVWEPIAPLTLLANGYYAALHTVTASDGLAWADATAPGAVTSVAGILNTYATYRVPAAAMTAYAQDIEYVGIDLGSGGVGFPGMTASVGAVTVLTQQNALVPVTAPGMVASTGVTIITGSANASVTAPIMTALVGGTTVSLPKQVSVTSPASTASVGTVTVNAVQNVSVLVTAPGMTASTGTAVATGKANVSVTSPTMTAAVGTATGVIPAIVPVIAPSSFASVGTVTVSLPKLAPVTAPAMTAAVGTVTISLPKITAVTAPGMTAAVGTVMISTAGNVTANVTAPGMTASVGTVSVAVGTGVSVPVTAPASTAVTGTLAFKTDQRFNVAAPASTAATGTVNIIQGQGVVVPVIAPAMTASTGTPTFKLDQRFGVTGPTMTAQTGGVSVAAGGAITANVNTPAMTASVGTVTVIANRSTVVPVGGVPWTPDILPGLSVHLDASKLALTDGATVDVWPNLGSSANPTFINAPKPTLKANAANGLPVVRFSANSGRILGTTSANIEFTMLYVARRWGPAPGRCFSAVYPDIRNMLVGFHVSGYDCAHDNTGWLLAPTAFPATPPDPWKMYGASNTAGSYESGGSATGMEFRIAGVWRGGYNVVSQLGGQYLINGFQSFGDGETGDFDVAEMPIYDRKLSDAERQQVEGYLAHKWGITVLLDTDHPYKLVAPLGPTAPGMTSSVGTVTVTGKANVTAATPAMTASVGTVTVSTVQNVVVGVTAPAMTTATTNVAISGKANVPVTSPASTAVTGTATVSGKANASVTAPGMTAATGAVTILAGGNIAVIVTAPAMVAATGNVTARTGMTVPVTSPPILAYVGTPNFKTDHIISVNAPAMVSAVGNVAVKAEGMGVDVWDGTEWTNKPMMMWDGSEWVRTSVQVWTGEEWV